MASPVKHRHTVRGTLTEVWYGARSIAAVIAIVLVFGTGFAWLALFPWAWHAFWSWAGIPH